MIRTLSLVVFLLSGAFSSASWGFPSVQQCQLKNGAKNPRFIILPGLNLKPAKMQDLADALKSMGFASEIIKFQGHDSSYESFKRATPKDWLKQVNDSYCRLKNNNNKVYLLAFSLGTAYGLLFQHFYPMKKPFAKIILFAPAIKGRWYTYAVRALSWWGSLPIPSQSMVEYRAHSSTPVSAYNNAHAAMDILNRSHLATSQVPTLVFLEPKDELIHYADTLQWIVQSKLDLWQVHTLNRKKLPLKDQFHHMMIDSNSLGQFYWKFVISEIERFLIPSS